MLGLTVNNYEIVSLIGEGGMGAVYLAEHRVMGRKAAVKFLRKELAEDRTLVARFINEARAANAIRHPNIIDIIDVGTLPGQGQPYMMMEFLEGESLAARLERAERLSVPEAIGITLQTASALGAAHAKGIVHRDLKPDNLFLVPDTVDPTLERVKVLDFGIAKLRGEIGSGSVKTNAGSIMGTPPYMSPEQCRGISDDVDQRTDVYAMGIILYQMLTGAPPFVSAGFGDVLVMHLTQPPAPPRSHNPDIPPFVEAAILRALAKSREERFASMSQLQTALGREPSLAPGSGARPNTARPTRSIAPMTSEPRATGVQTAWPVPRDTPSAGGRVSTTFTTATGEVSRSTVPSRKSRRFVLGIGAGALGGVTVAWVATVALRTRARTALTKTPAGRPPAPAAAPPPAPAPPPKALPIAPPASPPPEEPATPVAAPARATAKAARPRPAARPSSGKRAKAGAPTAVPAKPPAEKPAPPRPTTPPAAAPATVAPPSPAPAAKRTVEKW